MYFAVNVYMNITSLSDVAKKRDRVMLSLSLKYVEKAMPRS